MSGFVIGNLIVHGIILVCKLIKSAVKLAWKATKGLVHGCVNVARYINDRHDVRKPFKNTSCIAKKEQKLSNQINNNRVNKNLVKNNLEYNPQLDDRNAIASMTSNKKAKSLARDYR